MASPQAINLCRRCSRSRSSQLMAMTRLRQCSAPVTSSCIVLSATSLPLSIQWLLLPPKTSVQTLRLMSCFVGYAIFGRRHGVWGRNSPLTSRLVKCKGRASTRHDAASISGWEMGFRRIALPMMDTLGIFTSAMSQSVPINSRRGFVRCIVDYCTCLGTCVSLVTDARWTIFSTV